MTCELCLEAVLLKMHKAPTEGRTTAQLKQNFATRFSAAASDATVYPKHFNAERVNEVRATLPVVSEVLRFMTQV